MHQPLYIYSFILCVPNFSQRSLQFLFVFGILKRLRKHFTDSEYEMHVFITRAKAMLTTLSL